MATYRPPPIHFLLEFKFQDKYYPYLRHPENAFKHQLKYSNIVMLIGILQNNLKQKTNV